MKGGRWSGKGRGLERGMFEGEAPLSPADSAHPRVAVAASSWANLVHQSSASQRLDHRRTHCTDSNTEVWKGSWGLWHPPIPVLHASTCGSQARSPGDTARRTGAGAAAWSFMFKFGPGHRVAAPRLASPGLCLGAAAPSSPHLGQ